MEKSAIGGVKNVACRQALLEALYGLEGQIRICRSLVIAAGLVEGDTFLEIVRSAHQGVNQEHLELMRVIANGSGELVDGGAADGDILSEQTKRMLQIANAFSQGGKVFDRRFHPESVAREGE